MITWDEIDPFYYNAIQNEYVIPASVWEKQGTSTKIQQEAVVLPTKYTVKFENFSGNVQNTPVYVDLVGVTPYGGNYKFEASFRTEDKRPGEIENRKGTDEHDKWNVKRPAEQYYGEDLDKFYLCTIDTDQLYLESDASYKAFQASSSNARKLQGYDQHAQSIRVPYNEHTKEFHYYIGSKNDLPLTQGTLMIELPVTRRDDNGGVYGFKMDALRIDADQLKKISDIYSIEFGGLDNKQRLNVTNGLLEKDTVFIGGNKSVPVSAQHTINEYMDADGNLVIGLDKVQEDNPGKTLDGIRYVRIRFVNIQPNTKDKASGVGIRILGTTNVYADETPLTSRATLMRPARNKDFAHVYNRFYPDLGCKVEDTTDAIIIPKDNTAAVAYMYVEKPHPYGFLQAIFADEKLNQKGLTSPNDYSGSSIDANRWYNGSLPANPLTLNAPLGNIMDMEAYDRYQHSFLFTFGNQLIQGYSGTDKQYNAYSYSDIPKANFRVNIPENSTYTGNLGFSTTEILLDHDLEKYGTNPQLVLYWKDAGTNEYKVLRKYDTSELSTMLKDAQAAAGIPSTGSGQYTGMGLTSDARDVHIQIIRDMKDMDPAKAANIQYLVLDGNDKDKEIAAIEITYDTYFGNEHISKAGDPEYPADNVNDKTVLAADNKQSTAVINVVNKQNWIRIYGKPGTYNDDQTTANNLKEEGKSLTATSDAASDLTVNSGNYFQWKDTGVSDVETVKDRKYNLSTSFLARKATPAIEVYPYGTSPSGKNYDVTSERLRNASMGGNDAWYGVTIGNTGDSRIYKGIINVDIPITAGLENSQGQREINGYEVKTLESDDNFITNITRDGYIHLDSIGLTEHQPINKSLKPATVFIKIKKENKEPYPTEATLDSFEYTLTYTGEEGDVKSWDIPASKLIKTDASGKLIFSVDDTVWSSKAYPLIHIKNVSVEVSNYGSWKEDQATHTLKDNLKLKQNESLLLIKGLATGYLYEEKEDGTVDSTSKVIQDLTAKADWTSFYENSASGGAAGTGWLTRTSKSEGTLHLNPSEPTLAIIAEKKEKKGTPDLDISYEYKKDTFYHITLGNASDSGMSQPVLKVDLPLNGDKPEYETDKTKADPSIKTNAPQEERRRGFQMTNIRLDKQLLNVTGLFEVRVYDRFETEKDESGNTKYDANGNPVPKSYVIHEEALKPYLANMDSEGNVNIPYNAWYDPETGTGIKYPASVELVFNSFDGSVTEEKGNAGHVDIMGEINRYGDNLTYPQENIENNVYDNGLKAVASFIDYVAGTNIPINSKDGKDAIKNASFLVKEPLPILKAENQYYKGATEDVVPYSREYLSVFGITNDSISRMENFRFVMTPEMGKTDNPATGEETNRGFHTMDMIIRNKLFDEAVFDKITIEDEYKKLRLTLTRRGFTDPAPGFVPLDTDRNPYDPLTPATEDKAEPKTINENVVFDIKLTDLDGNPVTLSGGTLTTELSRSQNRIAADSDERTTLAKGLYNVYENDLVIPRKILIQEAGMSEISRIIVEGSDFKAMRSEDKSSEAYVPSNDQTTGEDTESSKAPESIVFVGISDKEIKGESDQRHALKDPLAKTTTTENTGEFNAYLYSHTYDQWADTNKNVTGTQDVKGNNFAMIADDNHRRSHTQSKLMYTPKLFFDTTISAVFKDSAEGRFTDETIPMYQNLATGGKEDNPAYNGTGNYFTTGNRNNLNYQSAYRYAYCYKDNLLSTLGYKSLAAYTVDFRQLGKLTYDGLTTTAKYNDYNGHSETLHEIGTVAQDYNAAANVEMAVSLPDNAFDAYFIKLRPALKPFVNSIRVYKADGTFYTITPGTEGAEWWKDNAQDTMANGASASLASDYTVDEDTGYTWWRINLLADNQNQRYENDIDDVDHQLNSEYEARDLVGTSSEAHRYYQTPSKVAESGTIKTIIINMSVNPNPSAQPAGGVNNLWDAIAADEGSWYKEAGHPEKVPSEKPYNYEYQVKNQKTRHSMEIAGRVIHTGRQEAKVGARLELGSQFNMMDNTSKDPVQVRTQDKVSRIRVQRSQLYDELAKDIAKKYADNSTGNQDTSLSENTKPIASIPKASVYTLSSSSKNYEKSSWSYRNWFEYQVYCDAWYHDRVETRYLDWHAAHLEDKTQIEVLNPDVRQDKGLGQTDPLGKPFADVSGNVKTDYSSLLPDYGTLRGYGIGVFQAINSGTEDTRNTYVQGPLYEDWYGRITHTDFVSMYDKLPYIGRQDGWYKGFYSRYLEMTDSIKKNLMNVEITIQTYKQDKNGNTVNSGDPVLNDTKPTATRKVVIPYNEIYRDRPQEPQELNNRILFCYAENTNGSLFGNDHLASASNAELSSKGGADQPGDPLNDQMLQWAKSGKYENIVVLEKNEYPSDITVRLVNLPGSGDWTDEYRGVIPDRTTQTDDTKPDWYVMGNVCDILAGVDKKFGLKAPAAATDLKNTGSDNATAPAGENGNYTKGQYVQKLANFTDGIVGFLQSRRDQILKAADFKDTTVTETEAYNKPVDKNLKTRVLSKNKDNSGFISNLAMWYAKNVKPEGKVETEAEGLELKAGQKTGVEIDPGKPSAAAPDQIDSNNTRTPLKDVYDYGGDNISPEKVRYRIWATNTTKKTESKEIPGLDVGGVYYDQLDYTDVVPEGLRTQKIWIPVQFISKTVRPGQTKAAEAHDLEVLKENKFTVNDLTLYLATKVNQSVTDPKQFDDQEKVFTKDEADSAGTLPDDAIVSYDLKTELLDPLISADGDINAAGGDVASYVYYADAEGNKVSDIEQAVYYGIDIEQMFWNQALRSVRYTKKGVDGFFQQFNLLGFKYSLKTRTDWRVDFYQNLMRYFRPNENCDATLTGTPDGKVAPAELQFEGIFVDHHFVDNAAANENTWDWNNGKENHDGYKWNEHSRPTVDTDPLVLSKIITNQVQLVMHTASLNSSTQDKYATPLLDNYKKLRFINRTSKINLSVNRLPYEDVSGSIIADPANGSPNYTPQGFSYGGNDFNKADPNTKKDNASRTPVDVSHLVPGDRVSYYVTAVNAKDTFPTESGEERQSVAWKNPVLRFDAPEGMRIARWVYMPEDFELGEADWADENGNITAGQKQPVSVLKPECGTTGFVPITLDDIDAYDPNHTDPNPVDPNSPYFKVPHNEELKDVFSNKETERPNWFSRMIAAFSVDRNIDKEVVTSVIWKINGTVPVNKGLRILVVLEVEDPSNNSAASIRNDQANKDTTALKAKVSVGGEKLHGYEPFYFTSTELQNHTALDKVTGEPDRRNYNYIDKYNPSSKKTENAGAIRGTTTGAFYGDESARQEKIKKNSSTSYTETVNYIRFQPVDDADVNVKLANLDGTHAEVTSDGMQFYTERYAANAVITADDAVDGENAVLTIGEPTDPTAADPDEKTQGTIRNEPYRNISYMDLTMDFISANNGSNPVNTNDYGDHTAVDEKDIRELQGFYLNRLPNRDELSYNSLSSSNVRDKMATMYVQFYDDVDTNGNLRSDLTLHVPYDKAHPNADRYAKNGYRKVYPASSSLVAADGAVKTNEDWYYWDEADRHFKPVDPRKIVRLRIEYMSLNAKDTVTGGYLVLPEIRLYGINVWQDIYPKRVQKAYSYNYGVDITQEWYRDASENDNSSNIAPDAPLDPSKTGAELEKE